MVIVFPAYAGMNLALRAKHGIHKRVPRIRGDEPVGIFTGPFGAVCSPHTRG